MECEKPVAQDDILGFERKYVLQLPNDYKRFLAHSNGINLMGTIVYGVNSKLIPSLEEWYIFEHKEVENPMYEFLIPFSPDGGGKHYCFNISQANNSSCDIVFWQHNYHYIDDDLPEQTHKSFLDWMQDILIDWTLENYDYNGNEKD
jgi:hypothetical protein